MHHCFLGVCHMHTPPPEGMVTPFPHSCPSTTCTTDSSGSVICTPLLPKVWLHHSLIRVRQQHAPLIPRGLSYAPPSSRRYEYTIPSFVSVNNMHHCFLGVCHMHTPPPEGMVTPFPHSCPSTTCTTASSGSVICTPLLPKV